jgi:hypothetical protein
MVGGNVQPSGAPYTSPNSYSQNQGNEDIIECHKPSGHSGFSGQPFYPGHQGSQSAQNRVPGGVYDHGNWGGTPTGVLTFWGSNRTSLAVLTSTGNLLVTHGNPATFYTGSSYKSWSLDRENLNAWTGARICIKGLYSLGYSAGTNWALRGTGCNGELLIPVDGTYKGWNVVTNPAATSVFNDAGGGWGELFALKPNGRVLFHWLEEDDPWELPVLPAGTPRFIGSEYVISTAGPSSRIYRWWNSAWQAQNVGYPSDVGPDQLEQIDDGSSFRGSNGEFFVWQINARVYLYAP